MSQQYHSSSGIDAVITWVDGDDPEHFAKRNQALQQVAGESTNKLSTGHHTTRFLNNGELYFCIASLRKFAPWLQNIYIVTDNQVPEFLTSEIQKKLNIRIVDHREIFESYEWALPTFNSMSIETAIWRIPGLSEQFIYLNDDFILTAPVEVNDFFHEDKVVLRGKWKKMINYSPGRIIVNNFLNRFIKKLFGLTRSLNLLTQIRSARLSGFEKKYFYSPHVPHPIRTKTVKNFYEENPNEFRKNINHPFRSTDQHTIQYLANHIEIKNGNALIQSPDDAVTINGELDLKSIIFRKIEMIKGGNVKFLCIQGYESMHEQVQKEIQVLFDSIFPDIG